MFAASALRRLQRRSRHESSGNVSALVLGSPVAQGAGGGGGDSAPLALPARGVASIRLRTVGSSKLVTRPGGGGAQSSASAAALAPGSPMLGPPPAELRFKL